MGSKFGVFVRQLEGQGREYEVEVTAVLEVSRTEKGRSKEALCEQTLSNGLSDGRLPGPREPVQPKDRRLLEISSPGLDLIQDGLPCAPEAASATTMLIRSPASTAAAVKY